MAKSSKFSIFTRKTVSSNEGKVLNTHFDIITFCLMIFYVVNLYTVLLILNNVKRIKMRN